MSLHDCRVKTDTRFWLLFPVSKYDTLGRGVLSKETVRAECFGCDAPFPTVSYAVPYSN